MKQFKGRVAVITGAASGIGRATALELARAGCHVALADLNEAGLESVRKEAEQLGVRVTSHRLDVSDLKQMEHFVEAVMEAHGGVNILVNNAGVAATSRFEDQELGDYEWLVGINFWGVVYGCKLFLPHLKQADEAHIVNLSSMFGLSGIPTQSAYCATKFAVRGFSESLWVELSPHGIGVTSVHPGMIATNIVQAGRMSAAEEHQRRMAADRFASQGMPPERAAKHIIKAIRRGRQRQLIGLEAHVTDWLRRAAPALSMHLVKAIYRLGYRKQGQEVAPQPTPDAPEAPREALN
ncbi:MAG: SDR family oxidoreductase [Myxococcales bacterium]|nr:SDR family oxidoreductase [Myxococcales bacterium]